MDQATNQAVTRRDVGVAAFVFLVATVWLTWSFGAGWQLSTDVPILPGPPSEQDTFAFMWNLWWFRQAVLSGQSPFFCPIVAAPEGLRLGLHSSSALNGLLGIPLQGVLSLEGTYNLLLRLSFVLTGLAGYALARVSGLSHGAALVTGVTLIGCRSRLIHLTCHLNIVSSQWFFLAIWCWVGWLQRRGSWWLVGFSVFSAAAVGASWYFLAFLALFGVIALGHAVRGRLVTTPREWLLVGGSVLGALLLASPLLWAAGYDLAAGTPVVPTEVPAAQVSADLLHFVSPAFGSWNLAADLPGFPQETHLFVGFAVLALAGMGWWSGNVAFRGLWCALGITGLLLALGPTLRVGGADLGVPTPYKLWELLPFLEGARVPARFFHLAEVPLALFAGAGAQTLQRRLPGAPWLRGSVLVAIMGVIVVERGWLPFQVARTGTSPRILRESGSVEPVTYDVLAGIALDRYRFGDRFQLLQQTRHGRPIGSFFHARPRQSQMVPPNTLAPGCLNRWGGTFDLPRPAVRAEAGSLVEYVFLDAPPATCDLADAGPVLPWKGWYPPEPDGQWARGREASLFVNPEAPAGSTFELVTYGAPSVPPITVSLVRGGEVLATLVGGGDFTRHLIRVGDGDSLVGTTIPQTDSLVPPLRLVADRAFIPGDVDPRFPHERRELAFQIRVVK